MLEHIHVRVVAGWRNHIYVEPIEQHLGVGHRASVSIDHVQRCPRRPVARVELGEVRLQGRRRGGAQGRALDEVAREPAVVARGGGEESILRLEDTLRVPGGRVGNLGSRVGQPRARDKVRRVRCGRKTEVVPQRLHLNAPILVMAVDRAAVGIVGVEVGAVAVDGRGAHVVGQERVELGHEVGHPHRVQGYHRSLGDPNQLLDELWECGAVVAFEAIEGLAPSRIISGKGKQG
mmetsp:Transcript_20002/g.52374  ORF Transcript_20002/g.52374 Transcript_20002/m.52374 type:complete len:234 (-) Transcript_20002:251-952(-)